MNTAKQHSFVCQAGLTVKNRDKCEHCGATPNGMCGYLPGKQKAEIERLREALRPFVDAYKKSACPVGDSDLYDEQPRSVSVTLGDCRRAARVLR